MDDTVCSQCGKQFATDDDPLGLKVSTISVVAWMPESGCNVFLGIYCSLEHMQEDLKKP